MLNHPSCTFFRKLGNSHRNMTGYSICSVTYSSSLSSYFPQRMSSVCMSWVSCFFLDTAVGCPVHRPICPEYSTIRECLRKRWVEIKCNGALFHFRHFLMILPTTETASFAWILIDMCWKPGRGSGFTRWAEANRARLKLWRSPTLREWCAWTREKRCALYGDDDVIGDIAIDVDGDTDQDMNPLFAPVVYLGHAYYPPGKIEANSSDDLCLPSKGYC